MMYNKSNLIEYMLLLKLIFHNKNIYFPNIFYVDIVKYLIPNFQIKNYYNDTLIYNNFIPKYNIKEKLLNILIDNKKLYCNIYLQYKVYNIYDIVQLKIDIYKIQYDIYYLNKILFLYEFPIKDLKDIILINKFITFDKQIIFLYEKYHGLFMCDYIGCNINKKIIYYELFKKIFLRFFNKTQSIEKIQH